MSDGGNDGSLADWLERFWVSRPTRRVPLWQQPRSSRPADVHPTKALRHLVEILQGLDDPVLLDLGLLSGSNVSFFSREVPCRIAVNDIYAELDRATRAGKPGGLAAVIERSLAHADASLDGALCWDICDYLESDEAAALASAVTRVLKPGGVALVMSSTVLYNTPEFTRYTVEDLDHIRHGPQPSSMAQRRVWLSRDVVRLFAPLRPDETYLLAHGARELLLRKPKKAG